ncbi:MAG: hypothetical protein JSS50_02465 [Proteobacteria bacterium]|nr:hypothetical protein [Pseudomonadota bacterium]
MKPSFKANDVLSDFTEAKILEGLKSGIKYGCDNATDFAGLYNQVNAQAPNYWELLHKIRLTAAEITLKYEKLENAAPEDKGALQKEIKEKFKSLDAQMRDYEINFSVSYYADAAALPKGKDAQTSIDIATRYVASREIILAGLQSKTQEHGITLPGAFSFPTLRQTNEFLEEKIQSAREGIADDIGNFAHPGKMTNIFNVLYVIGESNLINCFKEDFRYNRAVGWSNYNEADANHPAFELKKQYDKLHDELFPDEDDSKRVQKLGDARYLTTEEQDKLYTLLILELKIHLTSIKDPKERALYQNKLKFVETLAELPDAGRNTTVYLLKILAITGFAILSTSIPAAAAAADLAVHGTLQTAIDEAVKQNSLDIFNEKMLEAIHQVMPEFITVVTICGVLGMAGVLTAAIWPDNAPLRAIGNTETLRNGLKNLETAFAKSQVEEAQTKQ